jgi:hypothetical protein
MKNLFLTKSLLATVLGCAAAWATPPGATLSELKAKQMALGLYFDQSGQQLFEDGSQSLLNTTGAALEYALADYVQVGGFLGAAELQVDVPPGYKDGDLVNGQTLRVFDPGYSLYYGLTAKLASPRFLLGMARFVGYGQANFIDAEDDAGNKKEGTFYHAGLTGQVEYRGFNFVLGGEFYALVDGEQRSARGGSKQPFGLHAPAGNLDYARGIVGVEYFFKGAKRSFVSVVFRPTGSLGYDDAFGLQGGSVAVTLGAITGFAKQSDQPVDDESRSLGD